MPVPQHTPVTVPFLSTVEVRPAHALVMAGSYSVRSCGKRAFCQLSGAVLSDETRFPHQNTERDTPHDGREEHGSGARFQE
eukprot:COSAG01_NODE_1408_length_10418_cov_25.577478_3_plen_81_part_00